MKGLLSKKKNVCSKAKLLAVIRLTRFTVEHSLTHVILILIKGLKFCFEHQISRFVS